MTAQEQPVPLRYYLTIGNVPIMGILMLIILKWVARGCINPENCVPIGEYSYFSSPGVYLLSIPGAFIFWVYSLRDHVVLSLQPSIPTALLSMVCFMIAASLDIKTYMAAAIITGAAGSVIGCFAYLDCRKFCRHAFAERRRTIVAMIGTGSSAAYALCDRLLWEKMCQATAASCEWLLRTLGYTISVGVTMDDSKQAATLTSEYFTVIVYKACSGIEGVFLFTFLLSLVLLMDWKLLKKLHLIETYLIGFIFMYGMNVLRITSLFLVGHYAYMPNASPLMASMQGFPLHAFHSAVGQVYYFLAFMLFSSVMYLFAREKN